MTKPTKELVQSLAKEYLPLKQQLNEAKERYIETIRTIEKYGLELEQLESLFYALHNAMCESGINIPTNNIRIQEYHKKTRLL